MKIAFQGMHGAYSEVASKRLYGRSCATVPCREFEEVFEAVEDGRTDRGIIPIENSLAGSIHQNYDLLLSHRLHIVAESHLRVEHVLMCHPSSSFDHLTEVRSHPQALAQCSRFFARYKRIRAAAYFDTAGAAESIRLEGLRHCGAIANAYAAQLYGLKILRRNLENERHNFTRFLLLSRKPWKPQHGIPTKTSIAFTPAKNQVGILFRLLGVFSLRDIDLMKIESRPDPRQPFEYLFYVDFAGGPSDDRVARALEHLQEMVSHFRLLGTYPRDRRPATSLT
jgi:prephenate dehydratase